MDTSETWTVTASRDAVQIGTRLFINSSNPDYPMGETLARQIAALPMVVQALRGLLAAAPIAASESDEVKAAIAALTQVSIIPPGSRVCTVACSSDKADKGRCYLRRRSIIAMVSRDGITKLQFFVPPEMTDKTAADLMVLALDDEGRRPHITIK